MGYRERQQPNGPRTVFVPYDDNQLGRDIQGIGGASAAYNRGALALAALRSTVGDAKFREIEKTWV